MNPTIGIGAPDPVGNDRQVTVSQCRQDSKESNPPPVAHTSKPEAGGSWLVLIEVKILLAVTFFLLY